MEDFLFLILIAVGSSIYTWFKNKAEESSKHPPKKSSSEGAEDSPPEHLRELLKRYAEDHPEEELSEIEEAYEEELPEDIYEEFEPEPVLEQAEPENPVEVPPKVEPLWAKYQGKAFERRVEKSEPVFVQEKESYKPQGAKIAYGLNSVRSGFIWAKILDEPRFKKRWNPYNR